MSAGFKVADDVFWGTNGAVEAYTGALAAQAISKFGEEHPLSVYFQEEHDAFFGGKVLFLDEWLVGTTDRERFLRLLDAATEQLLRDRAFTDYGQAWVSTVIADLRAAIATG